MPTVKTISRKQLQRRLGRDKAIQFWNVLTDGYFKGELIPGSRRVALDTSEREIAEAHLSKGAEIIVYCGGPTCPQSGVASKVLEHSWAGSVP